MVQQTSFFESRYVHGRRNKDKMVMAAGARDVARGESLGGCCLSSLRVVREGKVERGRTCMGDWGWGGILMDLLTFVILNALLG